MFFIDQPKFPFEIYLGALDKGQHGGVTESFQKTYLKCDLIKLCQGRVRTLEVPLVFLRVKYSIVNYY